jgi:Na+/H+-translocating membrane pyrophosphatase
LAGGRVAVVASAVRRCAKLLLGLAVLGCVLLGLLLVIAAVTGFADIPCQDGTWDEARKTCVPS